MDDLKTKEAQYEFDILKENLVIKCMRPAESTNIKHFKCVLKCTLLVIIRLYQAETNVRKNKVYLIFSNFKQTHFN